MKVSILFALFFAIHPLQADFKLTRIQFPDQGQLQQEKDAQFYTEVKKNTARAVNAATFLLTLYAAYKASSYFYGLSVMNKLSDARLLRLENLAGANLPDASELTKHVVATGGAVAAPAQGWMSWGAGGVKNFFTSCGKAVAEGSPTILAGVVINGIGDRTKAMVNQSAAAGSVQWYIQNHTKLGHILKDLELFTIEYDVDSKLLNLSDLAQGTNIHIKDFVQDMAKLAKERKQDNFLSEDYFSYLFEEVKKRYTKKSTELEKLQDLASIMQSHKQRFDQEDLFDRDGAHRKDIANLCILLAHEVQKVSTFVLVHFEKNKPQLQGVGHEEKVQDLIASTNRYLELMESMLNSDSEQLRSRSKQNKGMFTCTYEFSKLLRQQCEYIHQYCAMIG